MKGRRIRCESSRLRHTVVLGLASFLLLGDGAQGVTRGQTSPYRFEWARAISGPLEGESGQDLVVAADGSVYVVGSHGGLDLDGDGEVDLPSMSCGGPCPRSSMDAFLVKFGADGYVEWIRSPDGPDTDWGQRLALDGAGGVYMGGIFREFLDFGSDLRLRSHGKTDGFIARYDAGGNVLWARGIGSADGDGVTDVAVDVEGHLYATATVRGAVDVDGDDKPDVRTIGEVGPLLVSYAADGTLRWARIIETSSSAFGGSIAIGPDGELYLGATYSEGTIDFDQDGQADLPPAGDERVPYLARFEPDGSSSWARRISSGHFAAADAGLLVTGGTPDAIDLDGDGSVDVEGGEDGLSYVALFAWDGSLKWVRTLPPRVQMHVATDDERIVVSGFYSGQLDSDGDGIVDGAADRDGKDEGIVAIFAMDGRPQQAFTVVGPSSDQLRAAGFSPDGTTLYATGFVRLTADFDGDGVPEGGVRCDARGDLVLVGYDVRTQ